jgi:hypothetical protein
MTPRLSLDPPLASAGSWPSNKPPSVASRSVDGEVLSPRRKGLLYPMGDGPLGKCVWEPSLKMMEPEPGGVTLALDTGTEPLCRVSAYLKGKGPLAEARRLCACWNAFVDIPLEEIENIARAHSGWVPPSYDEMWRHPDAPRTKTVSS